MVLCNGPNLRSKDQEEEINTLCEAAWQVWSEAMNRNPAKSHREARPRSKKTVPTDEPLFDLFEIYEDDVARTSAEEALLAVQSEEAEKAEQEAKVMRRRRLAAVGPYVMPAERRSAGWEICEIPELALVKKGLHIRSFMKGIEWRVAALFEDKWWDGTLLARLSKAHAKYPLYYSVRYTDGDVAYTPLAHEDYGVDREWVIIQKRRR